MLKQETRTNTSIKEFFATSRKLRLDLALVLILSVAFVLRLVVWFIIPQQGFVIDEQEYYDIGSVLASGRGWSFYDTATWVRPPLYLFYLAGIFQTIGTNLYVVRFGQILMSVATIYLLYRTTLLNFGRKTALWTAVLATLAWPFVVFPYLILTETLFLLVFTASIYCVTAYICSLNAEPGASGFLPTNLKQWSWLLGGGIMMGLAGLTRGQMLSFLPFVGLWLWLVLKMRWKQTIGAFLIILVAFGLVVAPWAYRNFVTFGRPLLDTTGGYNFYLGAFDGRDGHKVSEDLIKVKNQADRENLGYQLGLQKAFNNPAAFISKGLKESLDFWQINFGADERIEKGFTKGEVSPLWLIPDTIFNDIFYIILATLGLFGLMITPSNGRGLREFVIIWTLQNMALAFLFFAVSRFRMSVYFFLLPFAAYVIANRHEIIAKFREIIATRRSSKNLHKPGFGQNITSRSSDKPLKLRSAKLQTFLLLVPSLAFLLVVLPPYLIDFPITLPLGITSWIQQEHARKGDTLRLAGDYKGAMQEYQQAQPNNPATIIGEGLTYAAQGQYDKALALISPLSQDIAPTHLALGYIWKLQGNDDYARREFESRPVSLDENGGDSWAWNELPASFCASNEVKMGTFDWGCVNGFHYFQNDQDNGKSISYRWTDRGGDDGKGLSQVRFTTATTTKPKSVSIRLKGYRPTSLKSPLVEIWANNHKIGQVQTGNDWQTYTLSLPADLQNENNNILTIGIGSPTFVPDATDRRVLGVMLEWVRLQS